MLELDKHNRIIISKSYGDLGGKVLHLYYEKNEEWFYLTEEENSDDFFVSDRKVDLKNRVTIPLVVREAYKTQKMFVVQKGSRYYLMPVKH